MKFYERELTELLATGADDDLPFGVGVVDEEYVLVLAKLLFHEAFTERYTWSQLQAWVNFQTTMNDVDDMHHRTFDTLWRIQNVVDKEMIRRTFASSP